MDFSEDTNRKLVSRILLSGFGLVMIILALATMVAVRDNHIRKNSMRLVNDQLVHAQLLQEAQAQEDILSIALHRMHQIFDDEGKKRSSAELQAANKSLQALAQKAVGTIHAAQWQRLVEEARKFSEMVNEALGRDRVLDTVLIASLLEQHDGVVGMIHDLIQANKDEWTSTDEQMRLELDDLTNETSVMLGGFFLLAIFFAVTTVLIVRKSVRRIEWHRDELDRVSWQMLQTQEDTARRFSHELHDELGQSLAAVRANLSHTVPLQEHQREDCLHLVDEAIANVRELSQLLRPVILDDFGLEAGLRWLIERFGERTQIVVSFQSSLHERQCSDTETHLFRIAQEALTNIARHSKATAIKVGLLQNKDLLSLVVEDNGVGVSAHYQEATCSLGVIGMRARARECGGSLRLEGVDPHGLRLVATMPARPLAL